MREIAYALIASVNIELTRSFGFWHVKKSKIDHSLKFLENIFQYYLFLLLSIQIL